MNLYCPSDFVEISRKWCRPEVNIASNPESTNLETAKTTCFDNQNCQMFYDVDSEHERFGFCNSDSVVENSSILSSLYIECKLEKRR